MSYRLLDEKVIEIALAAKIGCPKCSQTVPRHRMKVLQRKSKTTFQLDILCSNCDQGRRIYLRINSPEIEDARRSVIGDRDIDEEVRLLESGPVSSIMKKLLPELIEEILPGSWEEPEPPKTAF